MTGEIGHNHTGMDGEGAHAAITHAQVQSDREIEYWPSSILRRPATCHTRGGDNPDRSKLKGPNLWPAELRFITLPGAPFTSAGDSSPVNRK